MKDNLAISVRGLGKRFAINGKPLHKMRRSQQLLLPLTLLKGAAASLLFSKAKEFWALRDITFDVRPGEKVGIIGRNGAGKSTLLKILSRLMYPTEGEARLRGRVTSLLEVGTGFNPSLTGRENIHLNASLHGLQPSEIKEKFDEIVEFSGVGKFLDTPVNNYSSGMRMRLGFSVAAHLDPDILMLDEVLAVGDLAFQRKCLRRVEGLTSGGRTILFVSHSLGDIVRFCDRVIWLDEGRIRFDGDAVEGVKLYEDSQKESNEEGQVTGGHRKGTGAVKFTRVSVLDAHMQPRESVSTAEDIHIALDYECPEPLETPPSDVFAFIAVENERSHRLFALPSEVLQVNLTDLGRRGQFICRVRRLPLVPGMYSLTVSLLIDRQLVDKVTNACKLVVSEGDFYGTGRLPLAHYGEVCVDFDWTHKHVGSGEPVPHGGR